jgi:hypothetical protein
MFELIKSKFCTDTKHARAVSSHYAEKGSANEYDRYSQAGLGAGAVGGLRRG